MPLTRRGSFPAALQNPKVPFPFLAPPAVSTLRKSNGKSTSGIAKVGPGKMAAPLELSCWGGGWGLPSVHSESLVVMVRPPRGPGRGKQGAGPEAGWVVPGGLQRFPAALPGLGRPDRCSLHRPGLPAAKEWVTTWPVSPSETGGRPKASPLGSKLFSALQSCRGGGAKTQSRGRVRPALHPRDPLGNKVPKGQVAGARALPRLETGEGARPPGQVFPPWGTGLWSKAAMQIFFTYSA